MFQSVSPQVSFPKLEEQMLVFWKEREIYEKSLEHRANAPSFVFYEGPPTANGMPHPGHCLTRAIKDLFPRYKTMRGYLCERKAGWDTHGLPVEVEVCKELGIHSKEEIEAFGVEPFIHKCQQSVWRYMKEWERLTERLGFWIHLKEAYVTYHQSFVESVWWSLKCLFEKGLLYQGHKIVWWWAQGGTALSSGEVGQGYREVADPSVFVRFPLVDGPSSFKGASLIVWTTTPWTLPSNQFAAVHPELEYAIVSDAESGEKLVIASALVEAIAGKTKRELTIEKTIRGAELVGLRYRPPFDYYFATQGATKGKLKSGASEPIAWKILAADFVTVDSGSGIVHLAPAFGEVDFAALLVEQGRFEEGEGPALICAVGPDGKFTSEAPDYEGGWVKDCDKEITRELKTKGLLFHQEQYLHDYPFCWRADQDPLIQYPRKSWFIRTTAFRDQMLENNRQIGWKPDHIRDGRFGNFLESNVDWALSRERYWGTPMPIWVCEKTGQMEAIGAYSELLGKPNVSGMEAWEKAKAKNPGLPDDLRVHKPYIDEMTYDSPFAKGARMRRVSEVIDCWYDSGAMPFAQWGYPQTNQDKFLGQFPADFISEAIDQTRGWFYSQLAISTMLFSKGGAAETDSPRLPSYPHPFKNCIVLGLMLSEWWEGKKSKKVYLSEEEAEGSEGRGAYAHEVGKMSKSKRNYREPQEIFDRYGADALRWYFFANQPPWTSIRYAERAIKDSIPEFLLRLWNCYSFFVIYANIDGFDPAKRFNGRAGDLASFEAAKGYRPLSARSELDRWVVSELHRTLEVVVEKMDGYDNYAACARINAFVDALSNWYVRRSRDRFWAADKESQEKLDAYWTLYECLVNVCKVIAPFTPFLAEAMWRNLAGVFGDRATESVHLVDFPIADPAKIDHELSDRMELLREIASLGRSARMEQKLKVRQPLQSVLVVLSDSSCQKWLEEHDGILREELNVKSIQYLSDARTYIEYQVAPNFKRLGPRLGKLLPTAKQVLAKAHGADLLAEMKSQGKVSVTLEGQTIELDGEDIQVRLLAKPGWAAAQGTKVVVILNTELTQPLIDEGYARDAIRLIQDRRKEMNLDFTDRIRVRIDTDSAELRRALEAFSPMIQEETLATQLDVGTSEAGTVAKDDIGEFVASLMVAKV